MFLHDKQHIAIAAGFVVLAGVAIAGWTRNAGPPAAPMVAAQQTGGGIANPVPGQPVSAPVQYSPSYTAPQYPSNYTAPQGTSNYPAPQYAPNYPAPQYASKYTAPQGAYAGQGSYGGSVTAEPDYGPGLSTDGYYASINQPVFVRAAEPLPPPPPPVATQYTGGPAYYAPHHVYRRRHHRSLGKSIAIVAGSAGAGAAIGAIAGGGPGAAIGAIAGGTGGFIYDRSTAHR